MANWAFATDNDGWTLDANTHWTSADGSPGIGCLEGIDIGSGGMSATLAGSWPVALNDPYSFRYRVIIDAAQEEAGPVTISFLTGDGDDLTAVVSYNGVGGLDTGWQYVDEVYAGGSTKTNLTLQAYCADGLSATIRLDSVYLAESPPSAGATVSIYSGYDTLGSQQSLALDDFYPGCLALRSDRMVAVAGLNDGLVAILRGAASYSSMSSITYNHGEFTIKRLEWIGG